MLQTVLDHLAWIEHQFSSGIRDSRKAGNLWGMLRGLEGVRKSINQRWLAKELGLGLGLLCWGFKGAQSEIPSEVACTLQIESVAFLPGQCTSLLFHPCHRLFDQYGHQDSTSASRYAIKSCFKLGENATETYVMQLHPCYKLFDQDSSSASL